MIPQQIVDYLDRHEVSFTRQTHLRAVSAQRLAHSVHVSGHRVAKSVIVDADDVKWIAVLSAHEQVDLHLLAQAIGARRLRLCRESEFAGLFPGCELGAEPPFGRLYGMPVVMDSQLARETMLVFRAGSHEEALRMGVADYQALEKPKVAPFAVPPQTELFPTEAWAPP